MRSWFAGMMWKGSRLVLGAALFTALGLSQAWAASLTASLAQDTIEAGDSTELNIQFQDIQIQQPPSIKGVTNAVIQYIGPSQSVSFVNGQQSYSITFRYQVTPQAPGEVRIPSLSVRAGGQAFSSPPLTLKVVGAGQNAGGGAGESSLDFVRLICPTNDIVLGESFPVEVKMIFTTVENAEPPKLSLEGFVLGKVSASEPSRTRIGDKIYGVVTWKMAVNAAKAGSLPFGPAEINAIVKVPSRRGRGGFDMDPFGMFAERKRVTLRTPTNTIHVVLPPAAGRPPDFAGAVGQFRMVASLSPTNVAVGDPITLKVQIAGHGNLDQLPMPGLEDPSGFKLYDPRSEIQTTDTIGLEGVKSFEQVVIAERADVPVFPRLRFSYFDPELRQYKTLVHEPTPITVRGAPATQAAPSRVATGTESAPAPTPTPAVDKLRHIQSELGPMAGVNPWWITRPLFAAALGLPLPLFALWSLLQRRREQMARDPRLQLRRRSREAAAHALVQMDAAAQAGDSTLFFESLGVAVRERIGLILGIPGATITEQVIGDRLRGLGMGDADLASLEEIFATLDHARFSPSQSAGELASLREKGAEVCRSLEAWEGRG